MSTTRKVLLAILAVVLLIDAGNYWKSKRINNQLNQTNININT